MIYDYISSIEKNDKFIFITIGIFCLYFATTLFPIDIRHIAGIGLGIFLIYSLNDKKLSTVDSFNRETELKLNSIKNATRTTPKIGGVNPDFGETSENTRTKILKNRSKAAVSGFVPVYLHNDADIINLLFNILDLREYNANAFLEMVKCTDNLLKIEQDIETGIERCAENIEVANKFKNLALNHFQSIIYSTPSARVVNTKFKNNIDRFQLLLRRHIDNMYRICEKQRKKNGYSYKTKPIYNSGPRPNDLDQHDVMLNFDMYN